MGGSQEGFTLDASASLAKGHGDGTAVSNTNTHVGGASVDIVSGGDTTLKGAVVSGNQVTAAVGGNLNVQSVQDTTTYSAKQQSAGASISLCIPPFCYGASTGSASFSDAKISGNFASVTEQSGIKAGDGGFQVAVNGNTTLTGAVISSSQAAIDAGKNSLSTAAIKTTDLHNGDSYSANGVSLSGSVSGNLGNRGSPAAGTSQGLSTSPGIASQSGSQGSTTSSGGSAGALTITSNAAQQALTGQDAATAASALNRGVTTDQDTTHALTQAWNGQQLMTQTQAALQITSTAMPVVATAIGDYAAKMTRPVEDAQAYTALKASQVNGTASPTDLAQIAQMESKGYTLAQAQATLSDPQALADYNDWKDDGVAKIGAHAVLGWLGGGAAGATGAGLSAAATPLIAQAINQSDLPDVVKQAAIVAASAAVGASVGGTAGAATGANQAANNFLRHQQAAAMQKELAACQAKAGGCSDARGVVGVAIGVAPRKRCTDQSIQAVVAKDLIPVRWVRVAVAHDAAGGVERQRARHATGVARTVGVAQRIGHQAAVAVERAQVWAAVAPGPALGLAEGGIGQAAQDFGRHAIGTDDADVVDATRRVVAVVHLGSARVLHRLQLARGRSAGAPGVGQRERLLAA